MAQSCLSTYQVNLLKSWVKILSMLGSAAWPPAILILIVFIVVDRDAFTKSLLGKTSSTKPAPEPASSVPAAGTIPRIAPHTAPNAVSTAAPVQQAAPTAYRAMEAVGIGSLAARSINDVDAAIRSGTSVGLTGSKGSQIIRSTASAITPINHSAFCTDRTTVMGSFTPGTPAASNAAFALSHLEKFFSFPNSGSTQPFVNLVSSSQDSRDFFAANLFQVLSANGASNVTPAFMILSARHVFDSPTISSLAQNFNESKRGLFATCSKLADYQVPGSVFNSNTAFSIIYRSLDSGIARIAGGHSKLGLCFVDPSSFQLNEPALQSLWTKFFKLVHEFARVHHASRPIIYLDISSVTFKQSQLTRFQALVSALANNHNLRVIMGSDKQTAIPTSIKGMETLCLSPAQLGVTHSTITVKRKNSVIGTLEIPSNT